MSEDKIKANAEFVIRQLGPSSGMEFGYNAASVAWVDGFIEKQRSNPDLDQDAIDGLVSTLGSYLGECIIRCYGGRWQNIKGEWCVSFDDKNAAYPFGKVKKQFMHGQEDSTKKFFELIPQLFKEPLQMCAQPDMSLKEQLEHFIRLAEDAYSSLYDVPSESGRAAAYSECKEFMTEAILLARQLGFDDRAAELEKKLEHYKAVFRHQMG